MASKTVYPFGTDGESTGGISKVVEYDCKAEMFLDNTKPIGTIAKLTDVYRYKKGDSINGETVYGIMIQEGSLPTSGTCLVSTTDNNSIFFSNHYGYLEIRDVFGVYEELDSSSTYLLSGDIYNLIKDGNFIGSSSAPDYDTVRYKTKKGTGRITYYVYNGHGWNVLKNTDLTKPQKLRVVHHCIPFGAKPGLLYVGKIINKRIFEYIGQFGPNFCPAMKFKNVAGKTISLSKLGVNHFDTSYDTSYYYSINTVEQTITFTNNVRGICWVLLKKPLHSNPWYYNKKRFGYYINYNGRLTLFTDSIEVQLLEYILDPITAESDFFKVIDFNTRPENFKNKETSSATNVIYISPHRGVDLQVLETGTLAGRIKRKRLNRATKWIRARIPHPRHGGVRKTDHRDLNYLGWNLLRVPKCGSGYRCGIFRIRRCNHRYTAFSKWTYWKLCFRYNGYLINDIPVITEKLLTRLKEIYRRRYK